jgi:hypothetical protein
VATTSQTRAANSGTDVRSSSPFDFSEHISVDDFILRYKLRAEAKELLEALQFTPGDDLEGLDEDAMKAGFQAPLWRNVVKANKHYRKNL